MKSVTKKILQKQVVGSYPTANSPHVRATMIEWSDTENSCFSSIDDELILDISWQLGGVYPTSLYVHEDLQSLKLPRWMYLRSPKLTFNRLREMWIEVQVAHRVAYATRRNLKMLRRHPEMFRKMRDRHANTK